MHSSGKKSSVITVCLASLVLCMYYLCIHSFKAMPSTLLKCGKHNLLAYVFFDKHNSTRLQARPAATEKQQGIVCDKEEGDIHDLIPMFTRKSGHTKKRATLKKTTPLIHFSAIRLHRYIDARSS